jgi:hypothetical protein
MRRFASVCLGLIICAGCLFIIGCGGEGEESPSQTASTKAQDVPKDAEQMREAIKEKMKRMQDRIKEMTAEDAHKTALEEALQWDKSAKLYYLVGEDTLKSDGTAKKWSAYFAVQEDPDNTPSREHGKKFVVLMMGGRIVDMGKKETPEEISYTTKCHAFLPNNWMSCEDSHARCFAALKEKYGDKVESAKPERLVLLSGRYYKAPKWEIKPTWRLTMDLNGSPVSASIHAITGEVLEVK